MAKTDTAIFNDGTVFLYLEGSDQRLRVEPYMLYLAPPNLAIEKYEGELLYTVLPAVIRPDQWLDHFGTKKAATNYRYFFEDEKTLVFRMSTFKGTGHNKGFQSKYWQLYPFFDFATVLRKSLHTVLYEDHHHLLAEPFDADWVEGLRRASWAGKLGWVHPVYDVCSNGPPLWVVDQVALKEHLGLEHSNHTSTRKREIAVRKLRRSSKSNAPGDIPEERKPPSEPFKAVDFYGVTDHIQSDDPDGDGGERHDWPYGIRPPADPDVAVGQTFTYKDRDWRVTHVHAPNNRHLGWMFEVEDEDGVISGVTQIGFERFVMGRGLGDQIPWRRDGMTYGDLIGKSQVNWGKVHKQEFFGRMASEVPAGKRMRLRCFRGDEVWVEEYRHDKRDDGTTCFRRVKALPEDEWERAEKIEQVTQKAKGGLADKLQSIADIPELEGEGDDQKANGHDKNGEIGNLDKLQMISESLRTTAVDDGSDRDNKEGDEDDTEGGVPIESKQEEIETILSAI